MENKKETAVTISSHNSNTITEFTKEQIDLIKSTIAIGATDLELKLFIEICKSRKLDPFSNQIYFIKRKVWNKNKNAYDEKATIQTGIDGYRTIAARSGQYAGNDDYVFDKEVSPTKATATVYRLVAGIRCPFVATARWEQYYPGDKQGFQWNKMPHVMLGKVAEALALRKAFPEDLSGIYTNEEMEQAQTVEEIKPTEIAAQEVFPVTKQKVNTAQEILDLIHQAKTKTDLNNVVGIIKLSYELTDEEKVSVKKAFTDKKEILDPKTEDQKEIELIGDSIED